jgi:hypothetical protein
MRCVVALVASAVLVLGTLAGPAAAEDEHDGWPEHGHVLLLHAELIPNPGYPDAGPPFFVGGFERCVDLANGRALPLGSHHARVHTGNANMKGLVPHAGHYVQPTGVFGLPDDCAGYEAAFN